jgi:hypothetical protein
MCVLHCEIHVIGFIRAYVHALERFVSREILGDNTCKFVYPKKETFMSHSHFSGTVMDGEYILYRHVYT